MEVHPIVTINNIVNGGINEALQGQCQNFKVKSLFHVFDPVKGEVSHDISGDVTLLIENFSGSLYEVTSPTGSVNRFDHRRVEIHDVGADSSNQLFFGGFMENPDATMKFHICPGKSSYEKSLTEILL